MQYKIIALLLLLPILSLGAENKNNEPIKGLENSNLKRDTLPKEARIKELIHAKQEIESAAVKLDLHIFKLKNKQVGRSDLMFTIYGGIRYDDGPLRKEFDTFVAKLGHIFNRGGDIKPLIDSIPAHIVRTLS